MAPVTSLFFDIDDTLYNSTRQSTYARRHAVEAMIDAGLSVERERVEAALSKVIRQFGSNFGRHYDEMLKELGLASNPHLVAAGVVAYHSVKLAYLKPFEETMPSLLKLRDRGYSLGIITNGVAVKQWEKLIRLGLQHFFHSVIISSEVNVEKPDPAIFLKACAQLGVEPERAAFVGNDPRRDVLGANRVGMVSIRILQGKYADYQPREELERADFHISSLRDLVRLVENNKL